MNDGAILILWALLRTGLVLSVSAVALSAILRIFPVASPTARRSAYVVVLLQGWLLVQGPLAFSLPSFVSRGTASVMNRLRQSGGSGATPTALGRAVPLDTPTQSRARRTHQIPGDGRLQTNAARLATSLSDDFHLDQPGTVSLPDADIARPTADQSSSPPAFPWTIGLVVVWATGMLVLAGRAAWTYFRFVRRLPPLQVVEREWADEWDALQRDAGIRSPAALAVAEQAGPVLCRLPGGYRLIVPAADWRVLTPSQRLLVLRHELAHLERRDVWKSLAVRVLALPHWFNPLVWRIVRQFDECAELACDERVGRAAPEHVPDYARALLQLAHRAEPVFFATRAARQCGLSQRIRRLLIPVTEKDSKMKTAVMVTLLLGICLVNLTRLQTRADNGPPATTKLEVSAIRLTAPTTLNIAGDATQAPTVLNVQSAPLTTPAVLNVQSVPLTTPYNVQSSPLTTYVAAGQGQPAVDSTSKFSFVVVNSQPESRHAKADLGRVLKDLHEYQRERERLQAEQQVWQATRAKEREELVRTAKQRIAAEKDPLIKDLLEKGITEKRAEMSREVNPKAAEDEQQVKHRLYEKIMAEINRYAQERQLLTVRRVDFGNRTTGMVGVTGLALGRERLFINTTVAQKLTATASAAPAEQLNQALVMLNIAPSQPNTWDQEVIYVAGRDGAQEIDISDEIAKRLNAADEKAAGK
jgi:beta-lactamase regulating signal transducer with metallopeptidase domain